MARLLHFKTLLLTTSFLVLIGLMPDRSLQAQTSPPACPTDQDAVDLFAAACRDSDTCENPATTCNGEFSIDLLLPLSRSGSLVTYTYEICKITPGGGSGTPALSHWVLGVDLDCLADGVTLSDILVGYSVNGVAALECNDPELEEDGLCYEVIDDPTTGLPGIKVEGFPEFGQGECLTYSLTFEEALLEDGYSLGVGSVPAATKAGKQDIRDPGSKHGTPGYACVCGPVCVMEMPGDEQCETAWAYLPGASMAFNQIDCDGEPVATRWGWEMCYVLSDGFVEAELWAGAGQNDFSKGEKVGTVTINFFTLDGISGLLCVSYNLTDGWKISGEDGAPGSVHLWIGGDKCDIPMNAAPGQFEYSATDGGTLSSTTNHTFCIEGFPVVDMIYLAAHAEVCKIVE